MTRRRQRGGLRRSLFAYHGQIPCSHIYRRFSGSQRNFERIADIPVLINEPGLRNKRLSAFSLLLMSRQMSSTVQIRLVSALMKLYLPSEFRALHSAAMRSPASCDRPTKYTRGSRACLANCFSEVSPTPLVAPTKTATRPGGRAEAIRELEDWTSVRETIVWYEGRLEK